MFSIAFPVSFRFSTPPSRRRAARGCARQSALDRRERPQSRSRGQRGKRARRALVGGTVKVGRSVSRHALGGIGRDRTGRSRTRCYGTVGGGPREYGVRYHVRIEGDQAGSFASSFSSASSSSKRQRRSVPSQVQSISIPLPWHNLNPNLVPLPPIYPPTYLPACPPACLPACLPLSPSYRAACT